ncbi:hypothetical protein QO006_002906 [Deinococcus enclensis]|uniref:Uncharacterized protein n=1 Tax=Deinococcus enclensis TaxID=1049582 RepID=A0ABT9MFT4_9DEIO|nr:hypothetical protein [Deinococcus enclensis]
MVQQDAPQAHPHAPTLPLVEPTLTGPSAPESQCERELAPWEAPAEEIQDAGEGLSVGVSWPTASGPRRGRGKYWLNQGPKLVRHQLLDHAWTLPPPLLSSASKARCTNISTEQS